MTRLAVSGVWVAWLAVGVFPLLAQAPPEDDLAKQVRQLVRQLGSATLAQRQQAQQRLLELGPRVLPLLPDLQQVPPEVRTRLLFIQQELQRRQAQKAVAASRISLQGTFRLSEILRQLEKQSGNRVLDYRAKFGHQRPDPKLQVRWNGVPFWKAVDELCDLAGLSVYGYPEAPAVALVGRAADEVPASQRAVDYQKAFRLEGLQIAALRMLNLRRPARTTVKLQVAWEPRLSPLALEIPWASVQAQTDRGEVLRVNRPGVLVVELVPGLPSTEFVIPLEEVSREAKTLRFLRGQFHVLLPGQRRKFEFAPLGQCIGKTLRYASVSVTLDSVFRNNQTWEVRLLVQFDQPHGALESHRTWIVDNPLALIDPQNRQIRPDGVESFLREDDKVGISCYFGLDEEISQYKLVYETPVIVLKQSFSWKLENLRLP